MADISHKPVSRRQAIASCLVKLNMSTIDLIKANKIPKGEVLNTARIAGILASKRTFEMIPLAHPIPLEKIDLSFEFKKNGLAVTCLVETEARTGVEMEALTGAAVAALTIYDMVKAINREAVVTNLKLDYKSGGKSGIFRRKK